MSYVRKIVSQQEKLLAIFRPHWIYLLNGFLWFVLLVFVGLFIDQLLSYVGPSNMFFEINLGAAHLYTTLTPISIIFSVVGLAVFWTMFLAYISSEVGLTDQRIIYKKGLMFIQVDQVDLDDIRAEHVYHGWFGWLLGYGKIRVNCRFIEDTWLPAIGDPYKLIKASHNARLKHPLIEYDEDMLKNNIVRIDENKQKAKQAQKISALKHKFMSRFQKAA